MKRVYLLLTLLAACGQNPAANSPSGKSLYGSWTAALAQNPVKTIDMTGGSLGTHQVAWSYTDGAICLIQANLVGSDTQGTMTFTNGQIKSPGAGGTPQDVSNCQAMNNGTLTYQIQNGNQLQLCTNQNACIEYL